MFPEFCQKGIRINNDKSTLLRNQFALIDQFNINIVALTLPTKNEANFGHDLSSLNVDIN